MCQACLYIVNGVKSRIWDPRTVEDYQIHNYIEQTCRSPPSPPKMNGKCPCACIFEQQEKLLILFHQGIVDVRVLCKAIDMCVD
uniref:Saposin B-type domain-containing protein n=1 Tax=Bursaphelenchus xylophilus TaxID=6326 RepID=A0A1I7S0H2_BURXY